MTSSPSAAGGGGGGGDNSERRDDDSDSGGDSDDSSLRARLLGRAHRIVIKVGSRLLSHSPAGRPAAIADEIARLRERSDIEVVVVSSGAISLGVRSLGIRQRPTELPMLQAAAAIGQNRLMQHWQHAFAAHHIAIGQVLLTHDDLRNRRRFLNARHALQAMLGAGVVPVINENDTVAVDEIKYGDNDLLAALVCNLLSADALVVLTDVDGLHDAPPAEGGSRIPLVRDIDREAAPVAGEPLEVEAQPEIPVPSEPAEAEAAQVPSAESEVMPEEVPEAEVEVPQEEDLELKPEPSPEPGKVIEEVEDEEKPKQKKKTKKSKPLKRNS